MTVIFTIDQTQHASQIDYVKPETKDSSYDKYPVQTEKVFGFGVILFQHFKSYHNHSYFKNPLISFFFFFK